MVEHISLEQVERWLDDQVVQEAESLTDEETEFNVQLTLSRLPIHLVQEDKWGPIRLVGKNAFDTEESAALLADDDRRGELLSRIGPVLAATPGFYTFLDEEGTSCELAHAESIQLEHRLYPDGTSQQALMEGLMGIATAMRYIQNAVAELRRA